MATNHQPTNQSTSPSVKSGDACQRAPPAIAGGYCRALWRAWAVEPRHPFRMRVGLSVQLVPVLHCGWTACLSAGFSAQGRWSTGERPGAKKFPAAVHPIYSNRLLFAIIWLYIEDIPARNYIDVIWNCWGTPFHHSLPDWTQFGRYSGYRAGSAII